MCHRKDGLKMKEIRRKELLAGIMLLAAFALWTVLIRHIDVQNAGPNGTEIGFYGKCGFTYAREFGIRYHDLP